MQQLNVEQKIDTTKKEKIGKGQSHCPIQKKLPTAEHWLFYVKSESSDNIYYFPKYKPDVIEFCSCKDYESNRAQDASILLQ